MKTPFAMSGRARRFLAALGLVALTAAGCAFVPPANELVSSQELRASGRLLILSVLAMEPPPNAVYALQINDGGVTLSFHGSATPAPPVVAGNEIRYAGYVIEARTGGPGRYVIDGRALTFTAPGLSKAAARLLVA